MKKNLISIYTLIFLFIAVSLNAQNQPEAPANNIEPTTEKEDVAEAEKADNLLNYINENNKFISSLNYLDGLMLPVGLKQENAKADYAIIITKFEIKEGKSFLDAYLSFKIPGKNKKIAFKGTHLRFHKEGGIVDGVLELVSNYTFDLTSKIDMTLNGGGKTFVAFDCSGFKQMTVDADIKFDPTYFLPEDENGNIIPNKKMVSNIKTTFFDWNDFLVSVSLEPFQFKDLEGFGFKILNATLDMSDYGNPPAIEFGNNYDDYFVDPMHKETWRGVFLQTIEVRFPPEFEKNSNSTANSTVNPTTNPTVNPSTNPTTNPVANPTTNPTSNPTANSTANSSNTSNGTNASANQVNTPQVNRLVFYGSNLKFDDLGISGTVGVKDLLPLNEGNMNGWNYSIDNFYIEFQSNSISAVGLEGQFEAPFIESEEPLAYTASIGENRSYSFSVTAQSTVKMDIWKAELELYENSTMEIAYNNNKFRPKLELNGKLNMNPSTDENPNEQSDLDTSSSKRCKISNIEFEGLKIQPDDPCFSIENISFGISQNKVSRFPISINKFGFKTENNKVGLELGVIVNFTEENKGGFSGAGEFIIWGHKPQNKWKFHSVQLNSISVDIQKSESFKLHGSVTFIRGDATFGNGFKGELAAKFGNIELAASVLFGNINSMRYWYADASVKLAEGGIPAGPILLNGFGGGAFFRMKQTTTDNNAIAQIGKSASGVTYIPDPLISLGLMASVNFVLAGEGGDKVVNGNVKLEIAFNNNNGINSINLSGNAYFLTPQLDAEYAKVAENMKVLLEASGNSDLIPVEGDKSSIRAKINMNYDVPSKTFHATFDVYVNMIGGVAVGIGPDGRAGGGVIHFDPEDWYIHLGTPDNPNGIKMLGLSTSTNYFMAGNEVPDMAPLPGYIVESFASQGITFDTDRGSLSELESGSGVALGLGFSFDTGDKKFLQFYGRFGLGLGCDIMLKRYNNATCSNTGEELGIKNWYASGQAYVWVLGQVGIEVNILKFHGKFEIFKVQAAAVLQIKTPNPTWIKGLVAGSYNILNGKIKGNCNFKFEIGEQCALNFGSPLAGQEVIAEIKPSNQENGVDPFATPQALFNLPIDEEFEFEDPETNVKKIFKIVLKEFSVKNSSGNDIPGNIQWSADKKVLMIKPTDILSGNSTFTLKTSVTFLEKKGNSFVELKANDGSLIEEIKTANFVTGPEPTSISATNIEYCYPYSGIYNYYPNQSNPGYIKLIQGQPNLFIVKAGYEQKLRFTEIDTKESVFGSFSYSGLTVSLTPPQNIKAGKVYQMEIINSPIVANTSMTGNITTTSEILTSNENDGKNSTVELTSLEATGTRVELGVTCIYSSVFRTSFHKTMEEKMGSFRKQNAAIAELIPGVHVLESHLYGERFDSQEFTNWKTNKMLYARPLLEATDWYTQNLNGLKDIDPSFLNAIGIEPYIPDSQSVIFLEPNDTQSLSTDEMESGFVSNTNTLTLLRYYVGYDIFKYLNRLKGAFADYTVTHGFPQQYKYIDDMQYKKIWYGRYPVEIYYRLPGSTNNANPYIYNIDFR